MHTWVLPVEVQAIKAVLSQELDRRADEGSSETGTVDQVAEVS